MKRNALLAVVGVIAVGAIGYAVYKSIKNNRDAKKNN
jgi:preprotein translocase subunit Sss1